jgi:hypothetical protein
MGRIVREASEIELHPDNMNRKDGFSLSRSWKPLVTTLNEQKKPIAEGKEHTTIRPSSARCPYKDLPWKRPPIKAFFESCSFQGFPATLLPSSVIAPSFTRLPFSTTYFHSASFCL